MMLCCSRDCSDDELSWSKLDSVASAEDSEKYLCVLILCREEGQQQLTAKRRGDGALVEAVEAGRRWSKAREGDGVIYLEGHVRFGAGTRMDVDGSR